MSVSFGTPHRHYRVIDSTSERARELVEAGAPHGLAPTGLAAMDVARIEAGLLLIDVDYVSARRRAERELLLEEAEKMGALYGREASAAGLSLAEAVEAFLHYRSPVLDAIAAHLRRRSADISDVTVAYREATAAIDQVLVALVGSHRSFA